MTSNMIVFFRRVCDRLGICVFFWVDLVLFEFFDLW